MSVIFMPNIQLESFILKQFWGRDVVKLSLKYHCRAMQGLSNLNIKRDAVDRKYVKKKSANWHFCPTEFLKFGTLLTSSCCNYTDNEAALYI